MVTLYYYTYVGLQKLSDTFNNNKQRILLNSEILLFIFKFEEKVCKRVFKKS